jgi:hypothetical protein
MVCGTWLHQHRDLGFYVVITLVYVKGGVCAGYVPLVRAPCAEPQRHVVFDMTYPQIDEDAFMNTPWKAMYGDVKEAVLIDAPNPLGKEVDLCLYVDSDHTRENFTQRSRTRFVIYLNMALIVWFSKQQPTVESSVFGAEFAATKNGIRTIRGIYYKL